MHTNIFRMSGKTHPQTKSDLVQKSPELNQPDSTLDFTKTIEELNTQVWNMQHKMFLTSLDVLTKNTEAYNSTCKTFANISKGIIDSWASTMKQNCNQQD